MTRVRKPIGPAPAPAPAYYLVYAPRRAASDPRLFKRPTTRLRLQLALWHVQPRPRPRPRARRIPRTRRARRPRRGLYYPSSWL